MARIDSGPAAASARTAAAMLRALGGGEVRLLLPVPYNTDATLQELGLATTGLEEVPVGPVVVRNLWQGTTSLPAQGQRWSAAPNRAAQYELVISAEAVRAAAEARQIESGTELLNEARGIMNGAQRLSVMTITTDYCGGVPYLYRVLAMEQSDASGEG
jgi:hypothetical protein